MLRSLKTVGASRGRCHVGQAVAAGGKLLKRARPAFWGDYSGYFADPDGHPSEIAHNPHCEITDEGLVRMK